MKNKLKLTALSLSLAAALGGSSSAMASAFQLFEQTAAGLGVSQANATAAADDPSTEYTNPAGMTRFKRPTVSMGLEMIFLTVKFNGETETQNSGVDPTPGRAIGSTVNGVPNFHFVTPIGGGLYYGNGISVPFGSSTHYGVNSSAAQYATNTDLQVINVSQDLAYRFDRHFSLGVGLDVQQFKGEFDTRELANDSFDFTSSVTSYAGGWHAGFLYQALPSLRFGVAYHSAITHRATGNSNLTGIGNAAASADLTLPGWFSFGAYYQATQNWAFMWNLHYTDWSELQNLNLDGVILPNPNVPAQRLSVPLDFHNTVTAAFGMTYQFTHKWRGKAGFGYDQSPVRTSRRELRLPDSDRYGASVGMHYQASKQMSFDVAYLHAFVKKASMHDTLVPIGNSGLIWRLDGTFNNSADILGVQATYEF